MHYPLGIGFSLMERNILTNLLTGNIVSCGRYYVLLTAHYLICWNILSDVLMYKFTSSYYFRLLSTRRPRPTVHLGGIKGYRKILKRAWPKL